MLLQRMLIPATLDHAPAIAAIHIASWRVAYAHVLPAEFLANLNLTERTELWRSRLQAARKRTSVVEQAGAVVAFCISGVSEDDDATDQTWEILSLHVRPDLRGGGHGSALFDEALEAGKQHGAEALTLWVVEENQPARRFYEKKGMSPDGARQQHAVGGGQFLRQVRYRLSI